jgi:hypothetical protein
MVPVSVTSSTLCHCSSVISVSNAVPPSPALFTSTSSRPNCATVSSMLRCTSDSTVTLATMPCAPSSSAVSRKRRSCKSVIATCAPSSIQRRAVADPIPVPAAAVTSTVRPSNNPLIEVPYYWSP